ncbi:hypothetical protein BDV96DRAFT_632136 [Lophiotrema nucula]|uniref:F-box domain-containing protein n=1 Tax=Lophiotrema nucula TaxID=690887 RepID=A0A6A5Z8D5_9PLEO|nr:hypothetical protein BDV96DRAFT_632136 [Lophiotrema nucula]
MSYFSAFLPTWLNGQPTSKPNSQGTDHPKQHIMELNMQNSLFYQLPTELLLEIDTNLLTHSSFIPSTSSPYVAQMALRATCRRFYTVLSKPNQTTLANKWNPYNRRAYSRLLRLATFRNLCEQERDGQLGLGKLVCCICRKSHDRGCFTPGEQNKRPEQRHCIGSQGVLELCPHFRITYAGLRLRPINIACNRKHYSVDKNYSGVVTVKQHNTTTSKSSFPSVKALIELRILLLTGADDGTLQWGRQEVVDAVKRAHWRVCPHIHTNNIDKWLPEHFGLDAASKSDFVFWRWRQSPRTEAKTFYARMCSAPHCCTTLTLLQKEDKDKSKASKNYLVLSVERDLGSMGSADDKKWMSQIVEASKLDEDQWCWRGDGEDIERALENNRFITQPATHH